MHEGSIHFDRVVWVRSQEVIGILREERDDEKRCSFGNSANCDWSIDDNL